MTKNEIPSLVELAKTFKKELDGITDIDELKEVYALQIARRDDLILRLQEQNKILLSSSIRSKTDQLRK